MCMNCLISHSPEEKTEAQRGAVAHTGPGKSPQHSSGRVSVALPAPRPGGGVRPSRLGEPLGSRGGRGPPQSAQRVAQKARGPWLGKSLPHH